MVQTRYVDTYFTGEFAVRDVRLSRRVIIAGK